MFEFVFVLTPMYVTLFWGITLLLGAKRHNIPKTVLSIFMFLSFVMYVTHVIYFAKEYNLYIYFDSLYRLCALSIYPVFYLYIRLLSVDTRFNMKQLWVLLPSFVFFIVTAVLYLLMSPEEIKAYEHIVLYRESGIYTFSIYGKLQIYLFHSFIFVFILQLIPIVYFGRKLVLQYDRHIREYYSNTEGKVVIWVKNILYIAFVCCFLSSTANYASQAYFLDAPLMLLLFTIIMSALYYVIGYLGYRQNFTVEDLQREMREEAEAAAAEAKVTVADDTLVDLRRKLLFLMENEQMFLDPRLKIADLALVLGTNRTYTSMIINNIFHASFSEFVNCYRIRYAKKLLDEAADTMITLDAVARESGFTNMNSFFRAFKKEENMTPAEYRKFTRKRL